MSVELKPCPLYHGRYFCDANGNIYNCQLPEGHGELIERSKLFDWYTGQRTKYPVKQDSPQFDTRMMYEIFGEIDDAPTIVPAERSKK